MGIFGTIFFAVIFPDATHLPSATQLFRPLLGEEFGFDTSAQRERKVTLL